ncbi:hypothetical protein JQX13_05410 [Archangium violaceum]|uniref:hypothetical protein n=1 Tax=Archangium violaceum TaxID=83451 RepID=UPI00193BBF21|nr:hypothetical protein [Archangium violaceum]QRK09575.1 hypothetical protein JQX13_05410 [Archangium violaceum]
MGVLGEAVGRVVGTLWSPSFRVAAELRHARALHPEGICLQAEAVPIRTDPPFSSVAERLAGPALVRLSTATWRGGREWPDILGASVRFRRDARITEEASPEDQDVLFATARHFWSLAPALLTTRVHDWLQNDYFGIAPFSVLGLGKVKLRLTSPRGAPQRSGTRVQRLKDAMHAGTALLTFEVFPLEDGLPHTWTPLADIHLREEVRLDPERLRFNPFLDGRGIRPIGFLHSLRLPVYRQSQEGRTVH